MTGAEEAFALQQQAVVAGNDHNFPLLLELVGRARTLTDDPDVIDRLDITNAFGEAELGNYDRAVALCEQVLAREGALPLARGLANSQLGMLKGRSGDIHASNRHNEAAIEILSRTDGVDPANLGTTHLNRGHNSLRLGDPLSAIEDFARAKEYFDRAGDEVGSAKAVFNTGYAHLLAGDLISALRRMDEAAVVLNEKSAINRAIHQQDRAEVLVASGRPNEAAVSLAAAARIFGVEGLSRFQAECEVVLARTILEEDPARSREVAAQAAKRFKSSRSTALADQALAAVVLAEIQGGGSSAALLGRADRLTAALREHGLLDEADRLALYAARLAVRRGQLDDARARLAAVRTGTDARITLRLIAFEVRAEIAAAQGDVTRARSSARQGLSALATWQSTFGSLDLQTSTVGHGQHLARLGLRAAMSTGRPAAVFEWSERARSLASRVTALRPPPDPELAADLTALRLAEARDRKQIRALREKVRLHSWFEATGKVGEPVALSELQDRLAAYDAAMVAHIVLDRTVTALVVTARKATIVPLGALEPVRALLERTAADLDFAAQAPRGRAGPTAPVRESLSSDFAILADLLVRPVLGLIGDRRVVLTPSAMMSGTAWTCLPGLSGRPVTVPTSATRWVEQTRVPLAEPSIVGFVAGPRVARASEEVARAAEAWPTAQTLGPEKADAARVGWLASQADLLHVASHGMHPGDNPLFAAVELADGPWFGHDVDLLPRTPAVVVLSACNLGQASVIHGEESIGMSAAWLHSGSRAVIASPALLGDDLACEVFAEWHRRVAAGAGPAEALAEISVASEEPVPLVSFGAGW